MRSATVQQLVQLDERFPPGWKTDSDNDDSTRVKKPAWLRTVQLGGS